MRQFPPVTTAASVAVSACPEPGGWQDECGCDSAARATAAALPLNVGKTPQFLRDIRRHLRIAQAACQMQRQIDAGGDPGAGPEPLSLTKKRCCLTIVAASAAFRREVIS